MSKTLRTLSDPDFTTKGNTLTWSELDQNFIDLYNHISDGSFSADLGSLDINGSAFVDSSRSVSALDLTLTDTIPELFLKSTTDNRADINFKDSADAIDSVLRYDFSSNEFKLITSGVDQFVAGDSGLTVDFNLTVGNLITINGTQIFDIGKEQNLSDDANVSFNDLSLTGDIRLTTNNNSRIYFKDTSGNDADVMKMGGDNNLYMNESGRVGAFRLSNGDLTVVSGNIILGNFTNQSGKDLDIDGTAFFSGNITTQSDIADDGFSDWFSANPAGYEIAGATGVADFRTVFTDELIAKAFTADVAQALAGSDFLTKSVAKVAEDFTIPAVSSSGTLTVEDLEGLEDLQTFESGDWVRIRIVDTTSSPAVIGDVWGQVTSYSDNADGTQDWTFTVDYAGPSDVLVGQTVYKGAIVLDYGVSGDTYIERTVLDRSGGSDFSKVPYDRIVRWTGTDPRTGTKEVLVQSGNINGLGGFSSATYGFFAKDNFVVELDGGNMKLGKNVGGAGIDGIHIDSNDYWYTDGTGSVGNGILNWDAAVPEVNLAGFTATANKLSASFGTSGEVVMSTNSTRVIGITQSGGFGSSDQYVRMFAFDDNTWGLEGSLADGTEIFHLGSQNDIAGIEFDDSKLWTGDGTNGYVGLGATAAATDRAFWAGAANADGSGSAGMYITQAGTMVLDTGAEITNTDTDFTVAEDGFTLWNDTAGQPTGATLKYKSSTNTNLEIYATAGGNSFFLSRDDLSFQRNGASRLAIRDDVVDITNTPIALESFTDTERNALSPFAGWLIYNSDYGGLQVYNGSNWVNI